MQKITPFLWFDTQAEEAMKFYLCVFKDSKELSVARSGENGPVFVANFELLGMKFTALNGGPYHAGFKEVISFMIDCDTQEEVDYYWNSLTADGGEEGRCGWLKDKFGLSWQVTPKLLGELMSDPDPEKSGRTVKAMMQMNKIDMQALQYAHDGKA